MRRTVGASQKTGWSERYKRPFDLLVLFASYALLAPLLMLLWAVIPLLIWLEDRGPVFYRQKRAGKNGHAFTVLKFRTMLVDAEKKGPAWTLEGDPRVTRVGRFLRRTALDELPELLSIWKGDMSLVGPRALDVDEQKWLEAQIPGFAQRLGVRPGLTGLAQVYDPPDNASTKLHYDLEYIKRMNPWLDLKVLSISAVNTLTGRWDRRSGKWVVSGEARRHTEKLPAEEGEDPARPA